MVKELRTLSIISESSSKWYTEITTYLKTAVVFDIVAIIM